MMGMRRWYILASLALVGLGCGASQSVTGLDGVVADEERKAGCFLASTCLERGQEATEQGRFEEAKPYLAAACHKGELSGCRRLADGLAIGAFGAPDVAGAAQIYGAGCFEGDDGRSCHSLGTLLRSSAVDDEEEARRLFARACELGDRRGCHDEAVMWIEAGGASDGQQERAVTRFEQACNRGLAVGCTNLAYMKAAGEGTGRDHGAAKALFETQCAAADDDWQAHGLMSLAAADEEPQVYGAAQYTPQVACDQLAILVVGAYEERILAAFEAEEQALQSCYAEAIADDEGQAGTLVMEAGLSADGDGMEPSIVDDELGLPAVNRCVEEVLDRYLRDGRGAEQAAEKYRARWAASFVHSPDVRAERGDNSSDNSDDIDRSATSCAAQDVQQAVSPIGAAVQSCGEEHRQVGPGGPAAVVARWRFNAQGRPEDVALVSSVGPGQLTQCVGQAIEALQMEGPVGDHCVVQLPFSFSDGREIHTTIVAR